MEKPDTNEPDDPKEKSPADDLVEEVKRIIEENDPSVTVEEIIPPRSMRFSSKRQNRLGSHFGND